MVFIYYWYMENFIWPFKMSCDPKKITLSILTQLMGTLEFLISSEEFGITVPEFNYEVLFKT